MNHYNRPHLAETETTSLEHHNFFSQAGQLNFLLQFFQYTIAGRRYAAGTSAYQHVFLPGPARFADPQLNVQPALMLMALKALIPKVRVVLWWP